MPEYVPTVLAVHQVCGEPTTCRSTITSFPMVGMTYVCNWAMLDAIEAGEGTQTSLQSLVVETGAI